MAEYCEFRQKNDLLTF